MANLTALVGLMNELIPAAAAVAKTKAKWPEMQKFVYVTDGPSDAIAVVTGVNIGLPAAATVSDRAAAITATRPSDALTQSTNYAPYRTHAMYTMPEMNRILNAALGGNPVELADVLADGLAKCYSRVIASIRGLITNADGSTTIPDLSSGTDALASTHTLADSSTYSNLGTPALTTTALQDGIDAMTLEKDWLGEYTYAQPTVLVAASASKIFVATQSTFGSSANDRNIAQGMQGVVLPGLGNYWMISTGPQRYGFRVEFRAKGSMDGDPGGWPWVGEPYVNEDGQVIIPYGCDYAAHVPTFIGTYVSNGTT